MLTPPTPHLGGVPTALMFLLGTLDFLFVSHAYHSILTRGASVQLVFGFEVKLPEVAPNVPRITQQTPPEHLFWGQAGRQLASALALYTRTPRRAGRCGGRCMGRSSSNLVPWEGLLDVVAQGVGYCPPQE